MENLRRTDDAQGIRLQNDHRSQTEDQETAENCGSQEGQKEVTLRRPESVVESGLSVWALGAWDDDGGTPGSPEDVFCGLPSDVEPIGT